MPDHSKYNNVCFLRDKLQAMSVEAHTNGQHREFLAALAQTLEYELSHDANKQYLFNQPLELMARVILAATRIGDAPEPRLQYMLDQLHHARKGILAEHPDTAQPKEVASA